VFPLYHSAISDLAMVGVFLFSALAPNFSWRWRVPLLLIAFFWPIWFLWTNPIVGEYAGLGYLLAGTTIFGAFVIGLILGGILRILGFHQVISVIVVVFCALCFVSYLLWNNFVPMACRDAGLSVYIAGKTVTVPTELQSRLETSDKISHFGRNDRKSDFSKLCRQSRNGSRAVDMDTIWINPASNYKRMAAACAMNEPPSWCETFSVEPYRRMGKIIIESDEKPPIPMPYWRPGGSLSIDRQGTLSEGSVCITPDKGSRTQCWIWQPFGDGSRLSVSTNTLDRTFDQMPIEEAKRMMLQTREMAVEILGQ
jgi:hypothetical protein